MSKKNIAQMSLKERESYYKSLIMDFTIFDDVFMRVVLDDSECIEYILQVILNRKDIKVVDKNIQASHENLRGKSIIMDCVAIDDTGKKYNIEIQRDSRGASPRRARYHSSILDANTLIAGEKFDELPESYVIFITLDDVLGKGKPIYIIDRCIRDTNDYFNDGSHIVYVDSNKQDNTDLGKLMHDLHCKNANEFNSNILGEKVRELKETQEGVETMCVELQKLIDANVEIAETRGTIRGRAEGRAEGVKSVALNLYNNGNDIGFIASMTNVPISTVQEWVGAPTA